VAAAAIGESEMMAGYPWALGITALILLVPSVRFMLLIERVLMTDMLAKVGS
jgi:hypothetical protein